MEYTSLIYKTAFTAAGIRLTEAAEGRLLFATATIQNTAGPLQGLSLNRSHRAREMAAILNPNRNHQNRETEVIHNQSHNHQNQEMEVIRNQSHNHQNRETEVIHNQSHNHQNRETEAIHNQSRSLNLRANPGVVKKIIVNNKTLTMSQTYEA